MIKPTYSAIAAVTIDGKIALSSKHNSTWTSKEDKDFLHKILDKSDVVIVGNNTYKAAKKPLSKRNCIVFTSKIKDLKQANSNLLFVNPKKVKIEKVVNAYGYKKIALLGGAQTYTYFLKNNLLDEIYLTIEPLVFTTGINLFSGQKTFQKLFTLLSVKKLNKKGSILLRYKKSSK